MAEKKTREGERARQPRRGSQTDSAGQPITTGDMQEVGALKPEEVERRRRHVDGEAPVYENPGDQNSG